MGNQGWEGSGAGTAALVNAAGDADDVYRLGYNVHLLAQGLDLATFLDAARPWAAEGSAQDCALALYGLAKLRGSCHIPGEGQVGYGAYRAALEGFGGACLG